MTLRYCAAMVVLTIGHASLVVAADTAKARKKLDDDYIAFTPVELGNRVKAGDLKAVTLFLDAGMDVNAVADGGATALHAAAETDRDPRMLSLLVKAGARVDALDQEGDTPLCRALRASLTPNALVLMTAAADPKVGCKGGTPFELAVSHGLTDLARALLAKGAPVNGFDQSGETPLYVSVSNISSSAAVMQLLLAAGGDPNLPTKSGDTPLHAAANRLTADFTKLLLDAGAKVDARDEDGATPLILAVRTDKLDIIPMLLAAGADPQATDHFGATPLKIAQTNDSPQALELLRAALKR